MNIEGSFIFGFQDKSALAAVKIGSKTEDLRYKEEGATKRRQMSLAKKFIRSHI